MRITKWGDCGIVCSMYIAKHSDQGAVGAAEIATGLGVDLQYLHQVLLRLKNGGIVDSVRGPKGGYKLSKPAEQISLREILVASEGSTFELFCENSPLSQNLCNPEVACSLREVWVDLGKAINDLLESRSLASLITSSDNLGCATDQTQASLDSLVQIHRS